jgi:hypothetical protein
MGSAHKLPGKAALILATALAIAAPAGAQFRLIVSSTTVNLSDNQARSIQVTAPGTTPLTYTVSGVPFWLSTFTANNFTTPDILSFQIANANCSPCTASIMLVPVTPPGIEAPVSVTVITVTYAPGGTGGGGTLVASPSSLAFSATSGQAAVAQYITLTTTGASAINIAGLASDATWLSAAVTSGSFSVSSGSPATLTASANAFTLAAGSYVGHITITPSIGASIVIAVTLNVASASGGGGTITASQTSFQFAYPSGTQAAQVTIGSNNPAVTSFNVIVASQSNWLLFQNAGSGTYGSLSFGAYTVTVNPTVAATLATGTYTGTLTLSNPQNGNDTTTINATLTVNGGAGTAALGVSPAALTFTASPGSPSQSQNLTVTVANNASVTLNATSFNSPAFFTIFSPACSGTPNLTFSCTFTGSQSLTITVNPANLVNLGLYSAGLQFQSGGSSVTVSLNLNLTAPVTSLTVSPTTLTFSATAGGAAQTQNVAVSVPGNALVQAIVTSFNGNFFSVGSSNCIANPVTSPTCSFNGNQTLLVTVNPATLTNPGTYNGNILLQSGGSTVNVQVSLILTGSGTGGSPGAIAAPASLAFAYQIGSAAYEPQQAITVGPVGTFTATASVPTNQQWLIANAAGSTGPGYVVVSVVPQGLAAGIYAGTVTIASTSGTMAIPVVLTVTTGVVVFAAPASVSFQYNPAQARPGALTQGITMVASDNSATPVTASTATPWIAVGSQSSSTTPAAFTLTLNPSGLCNGLNTGSVSISAPNAVNNGFALPVVVLVSGSTVTGCPSGGGGPLMLGASALTFNAPVNGPPPPAQNLTVIAPAPATAYTVSTSVQGGVTNWLTVLPSGSLVGSQTLLVSANQTGLAPGTYAGTISLNSNGAVQTVSVTLVVIVPPGGSIVVANPPALTFSADSGQSAGSQNVTLSTTSPSPIAINAVSTDSPNWLSAVWTSGSLLSSTSPVIVTVSATAARLPFGSITGHVTVFASIGPPITITVTFNVGTGIRTGTVAASPASLTFIAPSGQTPAMQTVVLTTASSSPVSVAIGADVSWLTIGVSSFTVSSTNPSTLSVTASAANLATGFYVGHLTITPSAGTATVIPVTFLVPPQPVGGTNLAQGKAASQSSTFPGYPTAVAASAVDGNTDGNFFDGSVTATNLDPNPWWQVDLGASATVNSIVIWNRTDCCGSRLNDYWVFVSDTPFLPTDTPATLQFRAGTFSSHQTAAPNLSTTIVTSGAQGRYVRVQLSSGNYLSLAEVQVFGTFAAIPNLAQGKAAIQSSTFPGYPTAAASSAVDGNTDGNFFDGSVTATDLDPYSWWQVDLGASAAISSIVIWNRTDCCGSRLNDYWVFVSDTPFGATDTPATLQLGVGTFSSHQTAAPGPSTTIAVGARGRYVRVQLSSANYLSLAEVQVFGQ